MLGKNLPAPLRAQGSKDGKDPQKEEQSHTVEELAQRGCSCPWEFWGHLWKKPWRPVLSGLTLLWGGGWTRDHQGCLPIGNIFNRNSSFYHFPLHFNGISHRRLIYKVNKKVSLRLLLDLTLFLWWVKGSFASVTRQMCRGRVWSVAADTCEPRLGFLPIIVADLLTPIYNLTITML